MVGRRDADIAETIFTSELFFCQSFCDRKYPAAVRELFLAELCQVLYGPDSFFQTSGFFLQGGVAALAEVSPVAEAIPAYTIAIEEPVGFLPQIDGYR